MADDYLQKLSLMNDGIVNYDETEGKYSINVKNAVYKICEAHLMKRILKKLIFSLVCSVHNNSNSESSNSDNSN